MDMNLGNLSKGKLYLITCVSTGKYYVGKTTQSLSKRFSNHCSSAKLEPETYLHRSIAKYGKENFIIEELAEVPIEQLNTYEKLWIISLNSNNPKTGMNLTLGGEGSLGWKPSLETLQRMSKSQTGRKHSEQTKLKIGFKHRNKIVTLETRLKIGEASKGRHQSGRKALKWEELSESTRKDRLRDLYSIFGSHTGRKFKNPNKTLFNVINGVI